MPKSGARPNPNASCVEIHAPDPARHQVGVGLPASQVPSPARTQKMENEAIAVAPSPRA